MVDELPDGLATMPPGRDLAVALAVVDRSRLGGSDAITLAQARARLIAHEQAQLLADLVEVARTDWHTPAGMYARMPAPDDYSVDQIAWGLTWSLPAARAQLEFATDLLGRLPAVYAALLAGRIDVFRARVFHEALDGVDDELATTIVARLIEPAAGWTCAVLRDRLRYHLHKADPGRARRRYQQAVAQRRITAGVSDDGTAFLSGSNLPVDRAAAADEYLSRLARAAKAAGDPRTVQQLRADAYLDLVTGIAFRTYPGCDPVTITADARDRAEWTALHDTTRGATVRDKQIDTADDRSGGDTDDIVAAAGEAPWLIPADAVYDPDPHPDHAPIGWADLTGSLNDLGLPTPLSPAAGSTYAPGDPRPDPPPDARRCCSCGGLRPGGRRGVITLTMQLTTLLGLSDDPALLPAWGPVIADIARQVALDRAANPSWQFAVTDHCGRLLHHGYTRRRPKAADLRHTRLRDRTCRAVGCRRPAAACQTDHRYPWSRGGPTTRENLDVLCGHHNRLKHAKNLGMRHLGDGAYEWRAPNGRRYIVPADDTALLTVDELDPRP